MCEWGRTEQRAQCLRRKSDVLDSLLLCGKAVCWIPSVTTQDLTVCYGLNSQVNTHATMRSDSSETNAFFSWTSWIHCSIVSGESLPVSDKQEETINRNEWNKVWETAWREREPRRLTVQMNKVNSDWIYIKPQYSWNYITPKLHLPPDYDRTEVQSLL